MIKNYKELLEKLSAQQKKQRRILLDIADFSLKNLMPQKLLKGKIKKNLLKGFDRVAVISIGKAAKNMAKAVLPMLGKKPYKILYADSGHPLPTQKGIKNTQKIIKLARSLGQCDLAIVLISGGGSAMLAAPVSEITLEDKINTTKLLLRCGATINEMNIVRKHLSQIKGGRLASLLFPAKTLTFVISDVIGNDLGTIASGPLTPDKSTFRDALKIIKKYKIKPPKKVLDYLEKGAQNPKMETPKSGEKYFKNVFIKIIADHQTLADYAFCKAKKLGLKCVKVARPITGEAREEVKKFMAAARPNSILIASGETTVTCIGKGFGGRNQEFVLSGLKFLKPNQTLLSIGTDGVDGICPQPIAGAIADEITLRTAKRKKLNPDAFLKNNDSYNFFKRTGGLIKTGPTGTNLGDLMMIIG